MQHTCITTLLGATYCARLLRGVGCCWLKFENGQIFHAAFVDVAWCCSHLAWFMQQCCAQACALACNRVAKRAQHVGLTTLQHVYVAFNCCDRLAGGCKCWANNVGICCVEMLRSFGQGLYHTFGYFKFPLFRTTLYFLFLVGFNCIINIYTFTVV